MLSWVEHCQPYLIVLLDTSPLLQINQSVNRLYFWLPFLFHLPDVIPEFPLSLITLFIFCVPSSRTCLIKILFLKLAQFSCFTHGCLPIQPTHTQISNFIHCMLYHSTYPCFMSFTCLISRESLYQHTPFPTLVLITDIANPSSTVSHRAAHNFCIFLHTKLPLTTTCQLGLDMICNQFAVPVPA